MKTLPLPATSSRLSLADGHASADDPRVIEALRTYLAALERGQRPDRDQFLAQHPGIESILGDCLDGLAFVHDVAPQLSAPGGQPGEPKGVSPRVPSDTDTLGDFRIIREVGRGGMGMVYEAEQLSLKRRVALKILPFASTLDPRQLQRFKNEAQAAANLHHTNIVPVFATGCERGVHFYAMQFIEGHTLAEAIAELKENTNRRGAEDTEKKQQTSPKSSLHSLRLCGAAFFRQVAKLGIQAAEALDHAHQMGIVHRDVKPANLMIEQSPIANHQSPIRLWVADFGLAQFQTDAKLTMTGDLLGTLRYMSPEQALAQRVIVDHRTDVYSLGVTLYELLTLEPVFSGKDRQEVLRQIAFDEPRAPRRINKAIPAELETIVLKAMEKRPEERYATAGEVARDLRRWLEEKPILARKPSVVQWARKWARRHQALVRAAVAMLVLAVMGLSVSTWLIWQEKEQTRLAKEATEQAEAAATERAAILEGVNTFLHTYLLRQAGALEQAELGYQPNSSLTLRQALDRAAEGIEAAFSDRPLIEAGIRRAIGDAYHAVGEPVQAILHLEKSVKLYREHRGHEHSDTVSSMSALGSAYARAGRQADCLSTCKTSKTTSSEIIHRDQSIAMMWTLDAKRVSCNNLEQLKGFLFLASFLVRIR